MHVLHLGAGNIYGGIERLLVSYAAGRAMYDEMVPHFAVCFPGQLETELRAEGSEVSVLGPARLSKRESVIVARRRLSELLLKCRPDVVVTHGPWVHCLLAPVVKGSRIRLAIFLHNPPAFHWLDLLARRTRPQLVIANSRFTLGASRWWAGKIPAVVCYPFGSPRRIEREAIRARLGIRQNAVVVLQASRLESYKGHRLHIEALSRLKPGAEWLALFVGATQPGQEKYARSLENLRDRLVLASRVRFLGHRTDIYELMAAADVFCHPNVAPEPFGMVFVEAMLAGLPVVATRMGGAEEILSHGGGRLVAADAGELATTLDELIRDRQLREDIGRRGSELARMRFTAEQGLRQLAEAIARSEADRAPLGASPWG